MNPKGDISWLVNKLKKSFPKFNHSDLLPKPYHSLNPGFWCDLSWTSPHHPDHRPVTPTGPQMLATYVSASSRQVELSVLSCDHAVLKVLSGAKMNLLRAERRSRFGWWYLPRSPSGLRLCFVEESDHNYVLWHLCNILFLPGIKTWLTADIYRVVNHT